MHTRDELLAPGKNALETCVMLSERGNPFSGERFMSSETVKHIFALFNEHGIQYAIAGGLALAHHAIPRATQDVDVLVLQEDARKVLELLREHYVHGAANVMFFDVEGTKLDVLVARLRYERVAVLNAVDAVHEGIPVKVISPRDFVLLKLLAAFSRPALSKRLIDRADIASVLEQNRDAFTMDDIAYIAERLRELCFFPEDVQQWRERIQWLNETLEQLGMSELKYELE